MKQSPILLDTEFTSIDSPRLISLGMVSTSGREFYVELSDSWNLGECTLFVLGQVLPHLDEGGAAKALKECLGDLFELIRWLTTETFDERKRLLATAPLQQALVRELPLAQEWEADAGLADLRAADVPRVEEALSDLNLSKLIKEEAFRTCFVAGQELAGWLEDFEGPVTIFADSPIDHQLTQDLLHTSGAFPRQVNYALLPHIIPGASLDARRRVQEARESAGGRRHHALDDARALAKWWEMAENVNILRHT